MTEVWPASAIFGPSTEIESSSYNPINLLSSKILLKYLLKMSFFMQLIEHTYDKHNFLVSLWGLNYSAD